MSDLRSAVLDGALAAAENEKKLIQCFFVPGSQSLREAVEAGVAAEMFSDSDARAMFLKVLAVHGRGGEIDAEGLVLEIDDVKYECVGGVGKFLEFVSAPPSDVYASRYVERLLDAHWRKGMDAVYLRMHEGAGREEVMPYLCKLVGGAGGSVSLKKRLAALAYDDARPVPEPVSVLSIAGRCVSTPGNLTSIISQAKSGKSALVGAIIASMLVADAKDADADFYEDGEPDTLGVTAAAPPAGKFVLHIDTEQSRFHFDQLIRRAKKRARCDKIPPWLVTYGLKGFTSGELCAALNHLVRQFGAGNIHAIILDGSADFVEDVNAAEECNPFIAHLEKVAGDCACPIIGVIHENPRSQNGKGRGHLGAQLERKAESNVLLEKDSDGVTTIFALLTRGGPIPKNEGPRFLWSDEAGMHMSTSTKAATKEDGQRENWRPFVEEVFSKSQRKALGWADALKIIAELRQVTPSTAEDWFNKIRRVGLVAKCKITGLWTLNPVTPSQPRFNPVNGVNPVTPSPPLYIGGEGRGSGVGYQPREDSR